VGERGMVRYLSLGEGRRGILGRVTGGKQPGQQQLSGIQSKEPSFELTSKSCFQA
jgi:hypothetical protein